MSGLVTPSHARIGEGPSRNRDELPLVAPRVKSQLEDAERVIVADLAVGQGGSDEWMMRCTTGTHDELPEPSARISDPIRTLRREALVDVIVPSQHDLRTAVEQSLPERDVGRSLPCPPELKRGWCQ